MQQKQFLLPRKQSLLYLLIAFGIGICAAISTYAAFLNYWERSLPRQAITLIFLALPFSALAFILIYFLIIPSLKPYTLLQQILWMTVVLLTCGILISLNWPQISIPGWHTLTIFIREEHNQNSHGNQAQLLEIKDETGQKIPFNKVKGSPGWEIHDTAISSTSDSNQTLSYRFIEGKHKYFTLLFATDPSAGAISVDLDGKQQTRDLYSSIPGEMLIQTTPMTPVEDPFWGIVIKLTEIITLGFIVFVFTVWGLSSSNPHPLNWRGGLVWFLGLSVALILLYGRYDWSADHIFYSWQSYLSSAYMLILTLTLGYALLNRLGISQKIIVAVIILAGLFFALPYHWLNLERFYYYKNQPIFYPDSPNGAKFHPDWLPGGLRTAEMPNEIWFFLGLIFVAIALAGVYLFFRRRKQTKIFKRDWVHLGLLMGVYLMILTQVWLHLSLRSPYVYGTHYNTELPGDWMVYLYPHQQGAVNSDYFRFQPLEKHFQGIPEQIDTMMIRRSYLYYISSQFTYFFPSFSAYLVLNVIAWMGAVLSTYLYTKRIWGNMIALYSSVLVGCGSGFIMFAANPMPHLYGYAIVIILIYLFEKLIVEDPIRIPANALLFGGLLGLGAMVYDIFIFYLFFLGYAILRRIPLRRIITSLVFSFFIYQGFLILQTNVLHLELSGANTVLIDWFIENIQALISRHSLGEIYTLTAAFPGKYIGHLSNAFFVIPLVLAAIGFLFLRDRTQISTLLLMLVPSVITLALFHFGSSYLSTLPRLVYTAFPAMYILTAVCIDHTEKYLAQKRLTLLSHIIPWGMLLSILVLNNLDVFNYPQFYYLFYYMSGGKF